MRSDGTEPAKRALVVGGGSGIGRAVVDAYSALGWKVAVLDRSAWKIDRLAVDRPDCLVHRGDARSQADCEHIVQQCLDRFSGLDVLVCCVGIFDFYKGLRDIAPEDLEKAFTEMMSVNVLGQLVAVKAAIEALRDARGSIILTGSSSGFYPGRGGLLYLASKYALRGCVAALGNELAPDIRVNGVAPGGTADTDIAGPTSLGMSEVRLTQGRQREDDLRDLTPLRLAMTPADHAGCYVFLASDAASGITGTFIHSDGGLAVRG